MATELTPIDEALRIILARAPRLPAVPMPLGQAQGRVLAADLAADRDQPPFDRSAMDGIALRAAEAGPMGLAVAGVAAAGAPFAGIIGAGQCVRIFTGAVVPADADCVVPVELVRFDGQVAHLAETPRPGQHVAKQGCEVRQGAAVVAAGQVLTAARLAVAAAFGHAQVQVARQPRVALLPTGDELVAIDSAPGPGQIRDSNRYALAEILRAAGAEVLHCAVGRDDPALLTGALRDALAQADVVVTCGGVSAGDLDLVAPCVQALGGQVALHKIAIKPGKPLLFATLDPPDGARKCVVGLPGNPVSAAVCCTLFAVPLLAQMQGAAQTGWRTVPMLLSAPLPPAGPRAEIVPLILAADGASVQPVATAGSADVFAYSRADWIGIRPAKQPALQSGDRIAVVVWPRLA